jgi:hypothetical protein
MRFHKFEKSSIKHNIVVITESMSGDDLIDLHTSKSFTRMPVSGESSPPFIGADPVSVLQNYDNLLVSTGIAQEEHFKKTQRFR